jgi:hypothetical protein
MAKIQEFFDVGDRNNITPEDLLVILEDMYRTLAVAVNKKPDLYQRSSDGSTADVFLNNGDININTTTLKVEMLTSHPTSSTVTWTQLS